MLALLWQPKAYQVKSMLIMTVASSHMAAVPSLQVLTYARMWAYQRLKPISSSTMDLRARALGLAGLTSSIANKLTNYTVFLPIKRAVIYIDKKHMNKSKDTYNRSWPTTIISSIVAAISLYFTVIAFKPDLTGIITSFSLSLFTILATMTAIEGKPKTLSWLIHSWFNLP